MRYRHSSITGARELSAQNEYISLEPPYELDGQAIAEINGEINKNCCRKQGMLSPDP